MASQSNYGVSDILYTFNQEVEKIDPKGVMRYLHAVLDRKDILDEVGREQERGERIDHKLTLYRLSASHLFDPPLF